MKVIIFAFVLTFISAVSTFEIKKIEGVKGHINNVHFDSKCNSYVHCDDMNEGDYIDRIYKLDPENNIIWAKEVVNGGCRTVLNNNDDLYLACYSFDEDTIFNISIIRANSSEKEYITTVRDFYSIINDNNGNLIYTITHPGLYFLKYNTTEPVLVKNLENFIRSYGATISDKSGNTYLSGHRWDMEINDIAEYQFAVVRGDSIQGTPEGYVVEGLLDDPINLGVQSAEITPNNEVLVSVTDGKTNSSIKMIANETITTIYVSGEYQRYEIFSGKTRVLIAGYDFSNGKSLISSLGLDGDIVEIRNSKNETWDTSVKTILIDSEGNAFIKWNPLLEDRTVLNFLNYTDTMTFDVDLGDVEKIDRMNFDGNNNLWITTADNEFYFVEKGSLELQKVVDLSTIVSVWTNTKKEASEIYTNIDYEYYVISK